MATLPHGLPSGRNFSHRKDYKIGTVSNTKGAVLGANTFTDLQTFKAGADIASATAVDLTAATGNTVVVTGTTPSTSLTMTAGQQMVLLPSGAWPLTYHATTMNINGGVSYTAAAGDRILAVKDLAGVIRVSVTKQDGTSVVSAAGGSMIPLSTVTASSSSTVDIETTFDSTYDAYVLVASGVTVSNDGALLYLTMKIGGSYLTTSTYNYHTMKMVSSTGTYSAANANGDTKIVLSDGQGNASQRSSRFSMHIDNPSSTSLSKQIYWEGARVVAGAYGNAGFMIGVGHNSGTDALTGIRIYPSVGTIVLGKFRLYGIVNS